MSSPLGYSRRACARTHSRTHRTPRARALLAPSQLPSRQESLRRRIKCCSVGQLQCCGVERCARASNKAAALCHPATVLLPAACTHCTGTPRTLRMHTHPTRGQWRQRIQRTRRLRPAAAAASTRLHQRHTALVTEALSACSSVTPAAWRCCRALRPCLPVTAPLLLTRRTAWRPQPR